MAESYNNIISLHLKKEKETCLVYLNGQLPVKIKAYHYEWEIINIYDKRLSEDVYKKIKKIYEVQ